VVLSITSRLHFTEAVPVAALRTNLRRLNPSGYLFQVPLPGNIHLVGVSPELLIADEPTSALDSQNRNRLLSLLMAQLESSGATLLVVSHDEQLRPYFGRILQMDDINTAEAA